MRVAWCLLCRGRNAEFVYSVRTHAPFVDHSIIVLHGSDEENKENSEFLTSQEVQQYGSIKVLRTDMPYDPKYLRDLYMEALDDYMRQSQDSVWFLITDSDEYLELPALYSLPFLAQEADKQGFNIVGFNSHDIQTAPDGGVWQNKSNYWNPNFNKHYPGMRYTPGTHIGLARPEPARMAKSDLRYFHVKTVASQWLRGCRNYWTTAEVAQNTTNDPAWREFKKICTGHGFEEFADFYEYMKAGNIHEDFKQWFIIHRNDENSEARSWFVVYFVFLHPEENIGLAESRDFAYDKDRKPCDFSDLSY